MSPKNVASKKKFFTAFFFIFFFSIYLFFFYWRFDYGVLLLVLVLAGVTCTVSFSLPFVLLTIIFDFESDAGRLNSNWRLINFGQHREATTFSTFFCNSNWLSLRFFFFCIFVFMSCSSRKRAGNVISDQAQQFVEGEIHSHTHRHTHTHMQKHSHTYTQLHTRQTHAHRLNLLSRHAKEPKTLGHKRVLERHRATPVTTTRKATTAATKGAPSNSSALFWYVASCCCCFSYFYFGLETYVYKTLKH